MVGIISMENGRLVVREKVKCVYCGREVDVRDAVYLEGENHNYLPDAVGYVCKDCWCNGRVSVACYGDCPSCPLSFYCWKWCNSSGR